MDFQIAYTEAKFNHKVDTFLSQAKITYDNLEKDKEEAAIHDSELLPKLTFMLSHMDYEHDRVRVRERFVKKMHQKSSLEDIGGLLDVLT